ncbi:site-specific integrase [Viridibacillus arvi]|uniref:site-specific integrase n=1 Tax=Viridibacillus arvi TaxID=263475 RepID=UPI0034CF73CF
MKLVQPIRDLDKVDEIYEWLSERSVRNALLFVFGIYTGLRISDLLPLRVKDVRGKKHVMIQENKTGNTKRFLIPRDLRELIEEYIQDKPGKEFLFKSRQGKNRPIVRQRAYEILKEAAVACGIKEIGTHSMRKTYGYHAYKDSKDIALLQTVFGHSKESITLRYIGVTQDRQDEVANRLKFIKKRKRTEESNED